ncbi:MAG: hypothetical protein CVT92_05370 [Bacteroidetes bacterium HGW-Bacteroidetes-1]|jgi:malate dehydrogenase (oxaloacetate-decarboxylating)(NADP+)|nr:MAG: hypothetical protein CVT92_05370 [Bacteroidetes bacterium HGW-Bacteroidetes-1]
MNIRPHNEAFLLQSREQNDKIVSQPLSPVVQSFELTTIKGIVESCLKIKEQPDEVYNYSSKGNLIGIITNGSAVFDLGNIGALASKPAINKKALLLKKYAGVDVFDIELNTLDVDVFVRTVITISPTFGAIDLESIKAPECFEIEHRLMDALDIPVMHVDQHGTAIVSAAGLLNACEIAGKSLSQIKLVINGAGTSALACANLYLSLGLKKENLIMLDSKGVISHNRMDIDKYKKVFATNTYLNSLEEALSGADAFVGLSKGDILTPGMIKSMADHPIIFAMANPIPEIDYYNAIKANAKVIYASCKREYPNEINNILGFPFIFRAALDTRASKINDEMKKAAVFAIASLAKEPLVISNKSHSHPFGRAYFLPKASDPRLAKKVVQAVAKAAIASGVASKTITDWKAHEKNIDKLS